MSLITVHVGFNNIQRAQGISWRYSLIYNQAVKLTPVLLSRYTMMLQMLASRQHTRLCRTVYKQDCN